MKLFKRKTLFFVAVGIVMLMLFVPFLRFSLNAASLGPTYLFPERLKAGEATDMILLITPSTDWSTGTSDREIRIYFHPGEVADTEWCLANVALTSSAVSSAPVNIEDWTITTNLPGTLVASCVRGTGGAGQDYIKVTGVGELTADTGYGLKITGDEAKFKLGIAGSKIMTIQLMEAGGKVESATFALQLLSDDQITVTADVDPADSISCSITPSSVPMGILYKGGAYITAEQGLGLTTDAATGFYWAVYGTGDPIAGVNAGLWNSTESYLLSSAGDTVNLLTGEGFGMVVSTSAGATVATNFQATTPGIFGGISRGFNNAKLFLSHDTEPGATVNSLVTLGARAGLTAGEGSYTETLTYICGAYIGAVPEEDCSTKSVGEECGGGKVAYLDGTGGGLIAASADNSMGVEWGCSGTLVGASGTAIGTGASNTSTILSGCATRPIAVSVCDSYDGGGYTDWFLPSKDELNQLYLNRVAIGGFETATYWSSSENLDTSAWVQDFPSGFQVDDPKINTPLFRCVRAF